MRSRFLVPLLVLAVAAAAQTPAKKYNPPRMPDGHPDLQGTYDAATLTPLERQSGTPLVMTKEEAAKQEAIAVSIKERGDKAIDGDRNAPPKGGDGSPGPAGNVGGYNTGWLDPGSTFNVVDGQIRASMIIDPPDGRTPPLIPGAGKGGEANYRLTSIVGLLQALTAVRPPRPTSDLTESNDPGLEKTPGVYDDPEATSAWRALPDSGLVPLPGRRCCRTTSTTTCIRSCRRRTRS